jgi:hypothetical protein
VDVPADTDYTMRLEQAGIGLAHARLRGGEKLTERDIVTYLAHSRVTEQRASEQMQALRPKAAVLAAGIRAVYAWERLGGWRMVSLRMPARRDALGGPAPRGLYA